MGSFPDSYLQPFQPRERMKPRKTCFPFVLRPGPSFLLMHLGHPFASPSPLSKVAISALVMMMILRKSQVRWVRTCNKLMFFLSNRAGISRGLLPSQTVSGRASCFEYLMKRLFICRRSLAPSEKKQERKEERGPTDVHGARGAAWKAWHCFALPGSSGA